MEKSRFTEAHVIEETPRRGGHDCASTARSSFGALRGTFSAEGMARGVTRFALRTFPPIKRRLIGYQ